MLAVTSAGDFLQGNNFAPKYRHWTVCYVKLGFCCNENGPLKLSLALELCVTHRKFYIFGYLNKPDALIVNQASNALQISILCTMKGSSSIKDIQLKFA